MANRFVVVFFLIIVCSGCATPVIDGFSKPTLATIVPSYLKSFPLNTITEDRLMSNLGIPDRQAEMDGKNYFSYELGQGYGKREWVYEISNGVVSDVRYHDQGPYNASSAKTIQNDQ